MNGTAHVIRPERFWAGGFLYNPTTSSVLLHKRDGHTQYNPHKWAFFGGLREGNESAEACYLRELEEEIGLRLTRDTTHHLTEYQNEELDTYRIVFYSISAADTRTLTLGEGATFDWVSVRDLDMLDLTERTKHDLALFQTLQQNVPSARNSLRTEV